jgi:hypothetical protein
MKDAYFFSFEIERSRLFIQLFDKSKLKNAQEQQINDQEIQHA